MFCFKFKSWRTLEDWNKRTGYICPAHDHDREGKKRGKSKWGREPRTWGRIIITKQTRESLPDCPASSSCSSDLPTEASLVMASLSARQTRDRGEEKEAAAVWICRGGRMMGSASPGYFAPRSAAAVQAPGEEKHWEGAPPLPVIRPHGTQFLTRPLYFAPRWVLTASAFLQSSLASQFQSAVACPE